MISDSKYEHYYSEFYNKNHSRAYHAITTCPLFKAPEVVDEDEEQKRRRSIKSLKSQCINRITSYNQVYHGRAVMTTTTLLSLFILISVDKTSKGKCPQRGPQ